MSFYCVFWVLWDPILMSECEREGSLRIVFNIWVWSHPLLYLFSDLSPWLHFEISFEVFEVMFCFPFWNSFEILLFWPNPCIWAHWLIHEMRLVWVVLVLVICALFCCFSPVLGTLSMVRQFSHLHPEGVRNCKRCILILRLGRATLMSFAALWAA